MAVNKVKIFASEIANVLLLFDVIQVQRSKLGTPFSDATLLTADIAVAAQLVGTIEGPYAALQGTDFKIKVDGGLEQTVTWSPANPISLANVIEEFNTDITGATASDDGSGKLKIVSNTTGTASLLEITGGTSLAILGFTSGDIDNGEDTHPVLLVGVNNYEYDDQNGDPSYWYRTRFYNTVSGTYSAWSDWIQGIQGAVITGSLLITGNIKLAELDGGALVGRDVTIVNIYSPLTVDGYFIAGRSQTITTNGLGEASIELIQGSTVDVVLEGTSFIRRILVPSVGTEFDLMDPSLVQDDPFEIQVPDLPAAVRRT